MAKAAYEIRLLGEVPPGLLDDFDGVVVSVEPPRTTVRVDVADEAALQGILDAIFRSGVVMEELRREHQTTDR
ncbi:MAG TPA: hypothetical protein PLZ93_18130 [Nocardioides sp.]|uniref:hypothetical protein n=1 Tax=uncultured Nocardioides sp. TaxID=198441 RepID=UPI000ECB377D|nr:hypothetical protein [uncultured Nocardioides sp.]HCB04382.1 hypothetical protein [Nocardioides sp.]HRD63614.1 hypothetical protein [Nocardioides sp.]HRI97543.1 hypothetical protein [Nocardioides sp.]HRK47204.1 hypothetical protein [Nocardioides sp.]